MKNIREIAENILGRALIAEDGISSGEIEQLENKLGQRLPAALKEFYLAVGQLDMFMSSFQSFPEPYVVADKIVFLEENQGVCYWGINQGEMGDPTVYMCTDIETTNTEWYSEELSLSSFLEIIMYYQCAQGGYEYGSAVYESNFDDREEYTTFLRRLVKDWEKVVEHNGLVIYQKEGKLIWHFTDDKGNIADTIFASVRTEAEMLQLEPYGFSEL